MRMQKSNLLKLILYDNVRDLFHIYSINTMIPDYDQITLNSIHAFINAQIIIESKSTMECDNFPNSQMMINLLSKRLVLNSSNSHLDCIWIGVIVKSTEECGVSFLVACNCHSQKKKYIFFQMILKLNSICKFCLSLKIFCGNFSPIQSKINWT